MASLSAIKATLKEAWPFGLTQAVQGVGGRLDATVLALHSPCRMRACIAQLTGSSRDPYF